MSAEKSSELSTSTAILLGSCVIAAGLYLGLRSGRSDEPPPASAAISSAKQVANETPKETANVPGPTVRTTSAPDKTRVVREASAFLDKHKSALAEKCLAPSLAKKPKPSYVKYTFNITFDAQGNAIARGVVEDAESARPEVLECIDRAFPIVRVSPPGQTVLVDVPFELP